MSSYWLSKPKDTNSNTNRFSILDSDEENCDENAEKSNKKDKIPKPPPIYVSNVENIIPLKSLLEIIAPKSYEFKTLRNNEIKIQPLDIESYRNITKSLEEKNTEFHTFRPKQERSYNVILKGIHFSTPVDEIKEEIEYLGHEILNISNIRDRNTKKPLQMFYICLRQNINNKKIFDCDSLLHTKIKFETPRKRREIVQCTRCQRYGHTKGYCHHSPRCVKCTGLHLTNECSRKEKSEKVKCVLCAGNHPANYKGCSVYKQLQQKAFPSLRKRHQPNDDQPKQSLIFNEKQTFSDIVRGRSEDVTTKSSQQSNDMADLKTMMAKFMDQMSAMMSLLTTVVAKLV